MLVNAVAKQLWGEIGYFVTITDIVDYIRIINDHKQTDDIIQMTVYRIRFSKIFNCFCK